MPVAGYVFYTVADIHCIILYMCSLGLGFIAGVLICIHSLSVRLSVLLSVCVRAS